MSLPIALPAYVAEGRVLGRQIVVGVDTANDPDAAPDASIPVGALVTFSPNVPYLVFGTNKDTIYPQSVTAVVGSDGHPKTPDGNDLYLIANVGQSDNTQNWYWQVQVTIGTSRYPAFRLDVTAGTDNYLSDQQPIPATADTLTSGLTVSQMTSALATAGYGTASDIQAAVETAIAGEYAPGGTAGNIGFTQADGRYAALLTGVVDAGNPSGGDDTSHLQTLASALGPGATLKLRPNKTYTWSALSLPNADTSIDMTGATGLQIVTGSAQALITLAGARTKAIQGTIDGQSTSQTAANTGIVMTGQSSMVDRTVVQNFLGYGVHSTADNPITNLVKVSNTGNIGIFAETNGSGATRARILDCTVDRSMISGSTIVEGGIKVHGHSGSDLFTDVLIDNPTVFIPLSPSASAADAIEVQYGQKARVTNAYTYGGTIGLSFGACTDSHGQGIFESASQIGAEQAGGTDTSIDAIVIGNNLTTIGLSTSSSQVGAKWIACKVAGTTQHTAQVSGAANTGTQFLGGRYVVPAGYYGVNFNSVGDSGGSVVNGVMMSGGAKAVMLTNTWNLAVTGCTIANFTQNAVYMYGTTTETFTNVLVTGCAIKGTPGKTLDSSMSGGAAIGAQCQARGNNNGSGVQYDQMDCASDQRHYYGFTNTPSANGFSGGVGSTAISTNQPAGSAYWLYNGLAWVAISIPPKVATVTLAGGTVTVSDTSITANSRIRLFYVAPGGTPGSVFVSAKTAGTGFTLTSTSAADTSTVGYEIMAY